MSALLLGIITLVGVLVGGLANEAYHAHVDRPKRRRTGDLVAYQRPCRLTVERANELGLALVSADSPWSESGVTWAIAPVPNAPCQDCWHRRDEHFDHLEICAVLGCACRGFDPFLDTAERAARA